MLTVKRKRLDRDAWTTIREKRYRQARIDCSGFHGEAALLHILRNVGFSDWQVEGRALPVSRDRMFWLELFPDGEDFAVTEIHDRTGQVVFRYLDMTDGTDRDEDGVLTFDDLFLDVIASEGYAPMQIPPFCKIDDRDELDRALAEGVISPAQYEKALTACERAQQLLDDGTIPAMCRAAMDELRKSVPAQENG